MAQRRKGARPTNKLWIRGNREIPENMVTERTEERDPLKTPVLAMPPDIYDEFQALKNATHLDSTTLMRKLLQDYHRLPSPEHTSCSETHNETDNVTDNVTEKHASSLFQHFVISQTSSSAATTPAQRASPTATTPDQRSSPIATTLGHRLSPIAMIPVQISPVSTIPVQRSSPIATMPINRSSPLTMTSVHRSPMSAVPSDVTGNTTFRSSSVSPVTSTPVASSPMYRSSSASALVDTHTKSALFHRSSTQNTDTGNREQPLDLSLLCKSENCDTETDKDIKTESKDNSVTEIPQTVFSSNSSSLVSPDISKIGFCSSENTVVMATGVPSRYHVVMAPGLSSDYSFLMPIPMSMQLPTVMATDSKQPNTVKIETIPSSATVNTGAVVGNGELGFSQLQAAALPFGVAVSLTQHQNVNILHAPLASQAGIAQPQISSSPMALHPQMMQQLSVSQLREHQTLTPLTVSQPMSQLSFKPQTSSQQSSITPRTVIQQQSVAQPLQRQSVVQQQQQTAVQPMHQIVQQQQQHPPTQSQQTPNLPPQPARRGRRPGSRGGKVAKPAAGMGEMKIIQENITFPGVYTSILKLPWSRRARYKTHAEKATPAPTNTASSSVLFPMESSMTVTSAPSLSVTDTQLEPSTTQSVMMVYPNATLSALGKPVRRRGRPPKLPLISHLLAEKNSKTPVAITQVTTSIANQEAASMLADGSLMSFLSKESIGASVQNDVRDANIESRKQNELNSRMAVGTSNEIERGDKMEICSPEDKVCNSADDKAKADSMYQEMILSSRVLISVKPRKRQLNDYMKSEDHFLCSSFKLKPRKTKPSRTAATELAERRKQIRSEKATESYTVGKTLAMLAAKLNPQTISGTKNIQEVTEHSASNSECYMREQDKPIVTLKPENYPCTSAEVMSSKTPTNQNDSEKKNIELSHQENGVVLLFCRKCKTLIRTSSATDVDMTTLNEVQCEKCTKEAVDKDNEEDSSKSDVTESKISCDLCTSCFDTPQQLCEHHKEYHAKDHQGNEDEYDCEYCGEVFCDVELLRAHVITHKPDLLSCVMEDCPQFFTTEEELNKHVKQHEKKRLFTCVYDGCKKRFMKNFHLQEHVRVKHFNIRAFRCPWSGCEKQFAAERHLKVHLLIHREEKPLECEFCNYRCRQRNALNWHMRKHPEAPYKYRKFGMLGTGEDV